MADREAHIPSVAEEVVGVVDVTTLSSRQYCVILDPVGPDGKPQLGQRRVVKVSGGKEYGFYQKEDIEVYSLLPRKRASEVDSSLLMSSFSSGICLSPNILSAFLSGWAFIFPAARGDPWARHPGCLRVVGGGGSGSEGCGGLPRQRWGETVRSGTLMSVRLHEL